jgi:hypothetical protein
VAGLGEVAGDPLVLVAFVFVFVFVFVLDAALR